jgi:hypothetical protein
MAAADPGTYLTTGGNKAIGQREDLIDKISRIDPEDTPMYSNAAKAGASAIYHEWQVQHLVAPALNAQPEGFIATYAQALPTVRLGNYCQIASKNWSVSRTLNVVEKAGRSREVVYQQLLKGIELRRDVEVSISGQTGIQIKKGTDPRQMASFPAYVGSYLTGATGTPPTGDGSTAPGAGTARPITVSLIGDGMQAAYQLGGKPDTLMVGPTLKRHFSALINAAGTATSEYMMQQVKQSAIIGAVSVYVTDFGDLNIVPSRFMPTNLAYGIDWDYITVANLPQSNFVVEQLAKLGDAENGMIVYEGTLRIDAPNAHFVVADLT